MMDIGIGRKENSNFGPRDLPEFSAEEQLLSPELGNSSKGEPRAILDICGLRTEWESPTPAMGMGDLRAVLDAWTAATERLEQTHQALQAEVQRLTRELEIKNRELARKNRLADLGLMASHVAHEVRNHLVPVGLYLNLLRRRLAHDPQGLEIVDKLETAFRALDNMVADLLHFTRDREPKLQPLCLRQLVEEVLSGLRTQCEAQKIHTRLQIPQDLNVFADADMLRRAVLNLLLNALDVMPDGGTITISASSADGMVELAVADTGPGIPEDALPKVFEPFFTTKEGGTGLGLTIVMRIAEAHHGRVTAENLPEGGACIRMQWPSRLPNGKDPDQQHLGKAKCQHRWRGKASPQSQGSPPSTPHLLAYEETGPTEEGANRFLVDPCTHPEKGFRESPSHGSKGRAQPQIPRDSTEGDFACHWSHLPHEPWNVSETDLQGDKAQ